MDLSRLADDKAGSDRVIRRRQHSGRDGLVIEGRCDRRNHLAEVAVVNGCRAGIAMMTGMVVLRVVFKLRGKSCGQVVRAQYERQTVRQRRRHITCWYKRPEQENREQR